MILPGVHANCKSSHSQDRGYYRDAGSGTNPGQSIRDYLAAHPQASPNEIVAGLKEQGITVSPGLASNVKYPAVGRVGR